MGAGGGGIGGSGWTLNGEMRFPSGGFEATLTETLVLSASPFVGFVNRDPIATIFEHAMRQLARRCNAQVPAEFDDCLFDFESAFPDFFGDLEPRLAFRYVQCHRALLSHSLRS